MLTHINKQGEAVMVDVGGKAVTVREARAAATIRMRPETREAILRADLKKGDALSTARIAGIQAAKRTWELIPLCHNIPLDSVTVEFEPVGDDRIVVTANTRCSWRTGVEMEALTAASVAALTIYDMCKAIDRGMTVEQIRLLDKTGGKSDYHA